MKRGKFLDKNYKIYYILLIMALGKTIYENIRYYRKDTVQGFKHSPLFEEFRRNRVTHPHMSDDYLLNHSLLRHGGIYVFDTFLGMFGGDAVGLVLIQKLSLQNNPPLVLGIIFGGMMIGSTVGATFELARTGRQLRHNNPKVYFDKTKTI